MKKLIYSLLFCTALMGIFSACNDNNEVFDRSAAERLKDAQDKAVNALKSAQNGWIMQYYSDTASYGGYTLWVKFDDRNVTLAGEKTIAGTHEAVTSQYTMKGDRGPVLSFSTYNKLFHLFSDPLNDGNGFKGDYEFMVLEASNDHMILQGKKRGALIRLTPLPAGETYESYLTKIDQMNENLLNASPFKWDIVLGDVNDPTNVMQAKINKFRNMNITYTYVLNKDNCDIEALWGQTEQKETYVPYILTTEGLQFYNPRQVGKALLTGFKWDADQKQFVAEGQQFKPVKLTLLNLFQQSEDSWLVDDEEGKLAPDVKEAWDAFKEVMMEKLGSPNYYAGLSNIPSIGNVLYFPGLEGKQGFIILDYLLTEPNRISFSMPMDRQYSAEGADVYINVPEFRTFLKILTSSTMLLEADNENNPSSFALRKARGSKELRFTFKKSGGASLFKWEDEEKKDNK